VGNNLLGERIKMILDTLKYGTIGTLFLIGMIWFLVWKPMIFGCIISSFIMILIFICIAKVTQEIIG
jgi:hypothetical protein